MEWSVRENQNGSSELYHYGVKGMRWGVRKEQETSGNRKPKLLSGTVKTRSGEGGTSTTVVNDKDQLVSWRKLLNEYDGNTPATYASEEVARDKFNNLPKFNARLSENQQRYATNHDAPNYKRKVNCFECSIAYEMRRRGYNVQANEASGGYDFEVLHAFDITDFFNIKVEHREGNMGNDWTDMAKEAYLAMEEQCLSYGNGARGMVLIAFQPPMNSGHAMNWVVQDGEFKIIDNQSSVTPGDRTFLYANTTNINVVRLDNAEVLPGVTDFVEEYKPTIKDKIEAKMSYNRGERIRTKEHSEKGESIVGGLLRKAENTLYNFVSKGMDIVDKFLRNPLNVQR